MSNKPLVSMVLFTYNAERYIENNLNSMLKQKYENFEIVMVDKFSLDKTQEIARRFKQVKIYQAPLERSTQANYGVKMAKGKYIFLTAVDMEYVPEYVSKCVEKCEKEGYDAIYTSVLTKNNSFFGRCKALERKCYIGDDTHETARFVKRQVFLDLGGYDENIVAGEDYDFQRRLNKNGYKTGRVDVVAEYHLGEEETLKHIIGRSYYYGKTFYSYFKKNGSAESVVQMSPIRGSYFKHWRIWLKDPLHTMGFIFYKTTQYLFASFGLITAVVTNYAIKDTADNSGKSR